MTVNISGVQFRQNNFAETVAKVLEDTGLNPQYLELELTESILMKTTEPVIETLKELKSLGVKLAIDDFGTGYSSLSYLKRFPLDKLKIDRSFVRDLIVNADDKEIIIAIIAIAHSLNLKVIAEGVETQQQLSFLSEKGSDGIQGFFLSSPIPAEPLTHYFKKGKY